MTISRLGPIYDPQRNDGLPTNSFIYIAFVKRNDDPQRMGRLSVWIPEIGGDPGNEASWIIVSYASPFAGATDYKQIRDAQTMDASQKSYGWWGIPPDLNNEVAVFFANGDISRGYWFACCYQQNMNHMIPGIAVDKTTDTPPGVAPVVEYNKSNVRSVSAPLRPRFTPLANEIATEGLTKDFERGPSSTSARREAPSKVFGYLTPRGNTIHVDDEEHNEFIRLRTRTGTQVLIHETTGYVYINTKKGNAWLEVSDIGVDVYSLNSVSIRAQQDLNVQADKNINLDAGGNINLRAGGKIALDSAGNININTNADLNASIKGNLAMTLTNGIIYASKDLKLKADASLLMQAIDDTSMKATRHLRDGNIFDNGGLATRVTDIDPPATVPTAKTQLDTTGTRVGAGDWDWKSGGGTVLTIVGRMPTHEPWSGHPNSKVPPPPTDNRTILGQPTYGGGSSDVGPDGQLLNDSGCSFGVAGTKPISTENYNAIMAASSTVSGSDPATLLAISDIESSHKAGIMNIGGTSSAGGLYQFTEGTWNEMVTKYGNQYNISTDPSARFDPNANAIMGAQYIKDNTATLKNMGISDPTPGQLYVMHFMGGSGGPKLISAAQNNPDADASAMFPAAAGANANIFQGRTVGQVYQHLTGMADAKSTAYANQNGLPAPCTRIAGNTGPIAPGSGDGSAVPANLVSSMGTHVGSGECVALPQAINSVGLTRTWAPGGAPNADTPIGTSVATFSNGAYANDPTTSHAGIFDGVSADGKGFYMYDQFNPQNGASGVVARRYYSYGDGPGVKNASNYQIINTRGNTGV